MNVIERYEQMKLGDELRNFISTIPYEEVLVLREYLAAKISKNNRKKIDESVAQTGG